MKNKLLKLLEESKDYISGEEISKIFNVSRSAIWKHIKALKEVGYTIEGVSKKGYKLISSPDLLLEDEILKNLNTNFIGQNVFYYPSVNSTNETAKSLARKAKDGSIIVAEEQLGGKGRLGRVWSSPHGGIWTSIILKPDMEPIYGAKITQVAAAAIIKSLKIINIHALIKWPNDIYINDKKLCGILTEMKCDMDRIDYLIVGVGINANVDENSFPEEVKNIATSLKISENKTFNRAKILGSFLNEFENLYLQVTKNNDYSKVLSICRNNSIILDKDAYLITSLGKEKVKCIGIDDDGALIIKDSKGITRSVISGEITFHE
jgi:BirA family biotin operon repressor/biotin-[acetyl-CoA-carboxylase] ligase